MGNFFNAQCPPAEGRKTRIVPVFLKRISDTLVGNLDELQ